MDIYTLIKELIFYIVLSACILITLFLLILGIYRRDNQILKRGIILFLGSIVLLLILLTIDLEEAVFNSMFW